MATLKDVLGKMGGGVVAAAEGAATGAATGSPVGVLSGIIGGLAQKYIPNPAAQQQFQLEQIGRASCRERVSDTV